MSSEWSDPAVIGLIQYLQLDTRPAFLIKHEELTDLSSDDTVFENASFKRFFNVDQLRSALVSAAKIAATTRIGKDKAQSFVYNLNGNDCSFVSLCDGLYLAVSWCQIPTIVAAHSQLAVRTSATPIHNSHESQSKERWEAVAGLLGWLRNPNLALTAHQRRVAEFPWEDTSMGPVESWPTVLRLAVSASMLNPDPRCLYWGPEFLAIYNEACIPLFGQKHPFALGKSPWISWKESWPFAETPLTRVMRDGIPEKQAGIQWFFNRHGYLEEAFFNSVFLPIPGIDSGGCGILDQLQETTDHVIANRQQNMMNAISDHVEKTTDITEYWSNVKSALASLTSDIVYALILTRNKSGGHQANTLMHDERLIDVTAAEFSISHSIGFTESPLGPLSAYQLNPSHVSSTPDDHPIISTLRQVYTNEEVRMLSKKDNSLPKSLEIAIKDRGFGDVVNNACIIPIPGDPTAGPIAFLILGLNPRRPIDTRATDFVQVLRKVVTKGAATVNLPVHLRQNQKRLEELHQSLLEKLQASDQETKRLNARFERMSGGAPVGMFMFSADGRKSIFVNDEFCSLFDITREELEVERSWLDKVHDDDKERVMQSFFDVVNQHKATKLDFRVRAPWILTDEVTGRPIEVERHIITTTVPEFDEAGNISNLQGWALNISQERFAQSLLQSRLEEVITAKQNADRFIDMVSHEMRNPLSAILQAADGLEAMLMRSKEDTRLSGENLTADGIYGLRDHSSHSYVSETIQHTLTNNEVKGEYIISDGLSGSCDERESILDAAQTIILCAQHQKRIVDDILTLSKLDSKLLIISPDKTNPASLLRKALRMFQPQVESAKIKVNIDIDPSLAALDIDHVMLDSSRVLQVIINLLTNAIKFTQHSKKKAISLVLSASKVNMHDDGDVQYIPRRDARRPKSISHDLSPDQQIFLTFMIRDTGKGLTEDEMKLLFQRFSQTSAKTYKTYGGSGLGLFISRELVELQGGQIGVSSHAGKGSTFAFYICTRKWTPGTPMSDGSRRNIEVHTPTRLKSPAIYSVQGRFSPTSDPSTSGIPIDRNLAQGYFPNVSSPISSLPPVPTSLPKPSGSMTILIVEDNVINQRVMAKQIRAAGHIVHVANHGLEALEFLETTCLHTTTSSTQVKSCLKLDVMLMDLEMPVLDGLTCVRKIRNWESQGMLTCHVPVIAVTANARSEQIALALSAGMDEVVTKPFRIGQVLDRAAILVKRFGQKVDEHG